MFPRASQHTNDHNVEVEALAHTFAVPLVRQICETNVACELPAHNVEVVRHLCRELGVLRCDGLGGRCVSVSHGGVAIHDKRTVRRRRW